MTKFLCFRNKLGYCKFGETCRNRHVDDICETENCDIFSCDKRHPKVCRFVGRFGRCKFLEYCKYDHRKPKDIRELMGKVVTITMKIEVIEKTKQKDSNDKELAKVVENKIEVFEKQIMNLKKSVFEKDDFIEDMKKRMKDLEKQLTENMELINKIKNLENTLKKQEKANEALSKKFVKVELEMKKKEKKSFKCGECEFTSGSEKGLKTHSKRMHTKKDLDFPKSCELCDYELESNKELKQHMKIHSYKKVDYKCEECYFCGTNCMSMEVHLGKAHSEK